jgi:ubiquinone/menaquinone biosynthesis C-methylase UbiE
MHALPWDDATFDVVTSFRGVWGTTADVVGEIRRVLVPRGAESALPSGVISRLRLVSG